MTYPSAFLGTLARGYLDTGNGEEALRTTIEGIEMMAHGGERASEAELLLVKGQALLWLHRQAEALAASLHDAVNLARQQGSKWAELRGSR